MPNLGINKEKPCYFQAEMPNLGINKEKPCYFQAEMPNLGINKEKPCYFQAVRSILVMESLTFSESLKITAFVYHALLRSS
jgi:hypothetical protein